jgi:capsular polysaccharide biosynthesis protein
MEKTTNDFILKRNFSATQHPVELKSCDVVTIHEKLNSIILRIEPSWAPAINDRLSLLETVTAKNILILNLNNCTAYGHIYSEVLSELYAIDETYSEYDCVITVLSSMMADLIQFFDLKLSNKLKFIKKGQEVLLNFEELRIVNHSPRSYVNKVKNVLALKEAFHSSKPIAEKEQEFLLYCSRNSPTAKHGRRLTQETETEIIEILNQYAIKNNLKFYLLTGEEPDGTVTPVSKQYDLFSNAKLVVGVHGGVMSNLIFLDPLKSPKIIEICPTSGKCFSKLFNGAIDTFAEYHTILYKTSPEIATLRRQSFINTLQKEESTIDAYELKRLLNII